MAITNLKIEFLKIKFKRKAASTGIKGKRQGHTILENRSDSEKKENMTMRKWRTLLAGLVLTFAVSAMAACGTNNDNVNDFNERNRHGEHRRLNRMAEECPVKPAQTNGNEQSNANGTTNDTVNGTGTMDGTNGTNTDNGTLDKRRHGYDRF